MLSISHNVVRSRDFISRLLRRKPAFYSRFLAFLVRRRSQSQESDSRNRTRSVAIVGSITISRHEARLLDEARGTRATRDSGRAECAALHRSEWLDRRHVCSLDGDGDGGGGDCSGVHRTDAPTRREKTVLTQCNTRR